MTSRKTWSLRVLGTVLFSFFMIQCGKGEKIEEIAGFTIYSEAYEKAYAAAVNFSNHLTGEDKKALFQTVCNPSLAPNAEAYQLAAGLIPENHYNQYRELVMISRIAAKEGFLDDDEIQEILELNRLQTIAQLYLGKRIREKNYTVTEEEKAAACQELRTKEPQRMAGLSAIQCLDVGAQFVRRQMMQVQSGVVEDEIKERANVKKNTNFDRENFLSNLALYKQIQKEGGCEDLSADEEDDLKVDADREGGDTETLDSPAPD